MNITLKTLDPQPQGQRAAFQEYPKMLFHENGSTQIIKTPEQEAALKARGYGDTPPPKPASQKIQLQNHPRSIAEASALGEQAAKFDEAYKKLHEQFTQLHAQFTELQAQHEALSEAHESLQVEHAALLEAKTNPAS